MQRVKRTAAKTKTPVGVFQREAQWEMTCNAGGMYFCNELQL